jgi:hypothetical protein
VKWKLSGPLSGIETFAEGRGIRELQRLIDTYGGKNWRKCKGFANIRLMPSDEIVKAELHWYEAHGVGKVEMKIKAIL